MYGVTVVRNPAKEKWTFYVKRKILEISYDYTEEQIVALIDQIYWELLVRGIDITDPESLAKIKK